MSDLTPKFRERIERFTEFLLKKLEPIMSHKIRKSYANHKPSQAAISRIQYLRIKFSELQDALEDATPASRERSVAITQLETAAMWAIKAVVLNDPDSVLEDEIPDSVRID